MLPRLGVGLGYRGALRKDALRHLDEIDFFELISDSFFAHEASMRALASLKPVVLHSLGLSVGSEVDEAYLAKVKRLVDAARPPWWTDHLAFTRAGGIDVGHLAPVAHDRESLDTVVANVRRVQQAVGGVFALENITRPFYWPEDTMEEAEFLREVVRQTGCYLLLDLENMRVNEANHGRRARDLLDRLPLERVAQVHIAGGSHGEGLEHDTHAAPVSEATWSLLEYLCDVCPPPGILLERDGAFPPFPELLAELRRARGIARAVAPQGLAG